MGGIQARRVTYVINFDRIALAQRDRLGSVIAEVPDTRGKKSEVLCLRDADSKRKLTKVRPFGSIRDTLRSRP